MERTDFTPAKFLALARECEDMAADRAMAEYRRNLLSLAQLWREMAAEARLEAGD